MKTQRSIYVLITMMSLALLVLISLQYVWLRDAVKIKRDEFDRQVFAAMRATAAATEARNSMRFLSQRLQNDSSVRNEWLQVDSGFTRFMEEVTDEGILNTNDDEALKTIVQVENSPGKKRIVVRTRNGLREEEVKTDGSNYHLTPPPAPPTPPLPVSAKREKFITVMSAAADEYAACKEDWEGLVDSASLVSNFNKQLSRFHLPADYQFAVVNSRNNVTVMTNAKAKPESPFKYKTELAGFEFNQQGLWLLLDFPSRTKYVFTSLMGMFVLALLMLITIIAVFAFALRLIFKQKKLNEMTNDFITNMTHEFKTPLATISMTADTLQLEGVGNVREQVKEYAGMIKSETQRLSDHVDRILDAASHKRQHERNIHIADLNAVVRKQLSMFENAFEQYKAEVEVQLPETSFKVVADEENLGYVISNLLDNALKYSSGQPEIKVAVEEVDKTVILKVADKGIGIKKEDRKLVFEKFFRSHTGNRHDVKGFGLGLSFVKNVVDEWGGKVWVESERGVGSTFFVQLHKA